MQAGAMDRKITLQTQQSVEDPYGGVTTGWADWLTVWAEVIEQSGREYFAHDTIEAEARVLFRTRWVDGVDETMQIVYKERAYNINAIRELGRREGLEFQSTWTA